jgi:hypothetical protein
LMLQISSTRVESKGGRLCKPRSLLRSISGLLKNARHVSQVVKLKSPSIRQSGN